MIIMAFGYMFHSVIGKVIHLSSSHNEDGQIIYDASSYTYGVSVVIIGLLIGALGFSIILLKNSKIFKTKSSKKVPTT
jgi:thiamine transporter ThiT